MAPKILKAVAVVLGALLLALAAYVAYVVLSYERLGDELSLVRPDSTAWAPSADS